MNTAKLLLVSVITIALALTACSNEDDISSSNREEINNTNVSVTLKLSQNSGGTEKSSTNDNLEAWAGKDKIKTVTIYLVDGVSVTAQSFKIDDDYVSESIGGQLVLNPRESAAITTSAGAKKVYALINASDEAKMALSKTPVAEFEKAYNKTALTLGNSGTDEIVSTSADKLAMKNRIAGKTPDETIMMTNVNPGTISLAANISKAETTTKTSPKNRISINLERAVARVMVSTDKLTYDLKSGSSMTVLGTISDIRWVLAQGENSLYIQRKTNSSTPNFDWVPSAIEDYWNKAGSKYDYSGLFEEYTDSNQFGGTQVATMSDYSKNDPSKGITNELNSKLSGKFILPNTHEYGVGTASKYKKGNTAYVLVRAKFTPSVEAFADKDTFAKDEVVYTEGNDFYVGANGKFYTSASNAVDPTKGGVEGQTVAKYVKGKVLYYAWVNPDAVPAWYNSPVLRNNIYHIHITGFKNLGTNWNPLFPEDPNSTSPQNPDPKPKETSVIEPKNPISPIDPLSIPETWMSVDVKVLPWTLHSYEVDLGI